MDKQQLLRKLEAMLDEFARASRVVRKTDSEATNHSI